MPLPTTSYDQAPVYPDAITVRFRTKLCAPDPTNITVRPDSMWYIVDTSLRQILIAFPGQTPHINQQLLGYPSLYILHDECLAIFDGTSNVPTNDTALRALAQQLVLDFYNWRSISFDLVYNGIIAPFNDALIDNMIIDYEIDGCQTRLLSAPWQGEPEEYYHLDQNCFPHDPIVYVPTATRVGNFLRLPKAYIMDDCGVITLQTSSYDDIHICCRSSSSSSESSKSHSDKCPTMECPSGCNGAAPCCIIFLVQGIVGGDLSCAGLNLLYYMSHVSGCTWYAPQGTTQMLTPAPGYTATLNFGAGGWTLTVVGGGHVAVFQDNCIGEPPFNCTQTQGGYRFCISSIDGPCMPSMPNATAVIQNANVDHCVQV